jgi:hypothetical protein
VSFKLTFDNKTKLKRNSALIREEARLPAVSSSILFEIFPFVIVYGEDMKVQTIGRSLNQVKERRNCLGSISLKCNAPISTPNSVEKVVTCCR